MPYVQRDDSGAIIGRFANAQPGFAEEWLHDDAPELRPTPDVIRQQLCQDIDAAADNARRAVVGDALRGEEYKKATAESQAFKDAGYPANAVPRTVSAWAIGGRTSQAAADDILAQAIAYNEALYLLRETRLQAKELVRQAMAAGNIEQAEDIAEETIASIEAAVAGIGNARG